MRRRWIRTVGATTLGLFVVFVAGAYVAGSALMAPEPSRVGDLPPDLVGDVVRIPSASGSALAGWFVPGRDGAVVLFHGLRASRLAMLGRARMLRDAGYSVLLVDFQAHGESPGAHVTFGVLERLDAQAAVAFVRQRLPGQRVAAIGTSLGGAAAILAEPPLDVDALVLESVYPDVDRAVADRLEMRFGAIGRMLGPALTMQIRPRLGFAPRKLRPIDRVGALTMPKLFIAGSDDEHTPLAESEALFAAVAEPKALWIVLGARHVDLARYAGAEYDRRVLDFLGATLRGAAPAAEP